jgi:hypothetical protein
MALPHRTATSHELRVLAVDTHRDPRSVARALDGRPCKPMVRAMVLDAVRARGWEHLLARPENDTAAPTAA